MLIDYVHLIKKTPCPPPVQPYLHSSSLETHWWGVFVLLLFWLMSLKCLWWSFITFTKIISAEHGHNTESWWTGTGRSRVRWLCHNRTTWTFNAQTPFSKRQREQEEVIEGKERGALSNPNWPGKGFYPHKTGLMVLCREDAQRLTRLNPCPLLKTSGSSTL